MDAKLKSQMKARLQKICEANDGLLTPDDVLKDARSKSSPLHGWFDWDDSSAAHKHRLYQARRLINVIEITPVRTERVELTVPEYIRDPRQGDKQGYRQTVAVRSDEELAKESLLYEFERAVGCLRRARAVASGLGLEAELEDLIAKTIHVQKQVQKRRSRPARGAGVAASA